MTPIITVEVVVEQGPMPQAVIFEKRARNHEKVVQTAVERR